MYQYYTDVEDNGYLDNHELRTATARNVLQKIVSIIPTGKLLDVGCSTGDFLLAASEHYDVEGLELSGWASDIARKKGLSIHPLTVDELEQRGAKYDVITMWGVIEHLEYPLDEMRRINTLLNPGGIVCFWTGDSSSISYRIFGKNWWYVIGQHIQLFSRKSVRRLMERTVFEEIGIDTYPYVISLDYLGTSMSRYPLFGTVANLILKFPLWRNSSITLKLPGEMFAIFQKRIGNTFTS